ncbi:MAG: WhiB family transcriptional regulator [Acidimicrobiales bacterium]
MSSAGWQEQGLCRRVDGKFFFAEDSRYAKAVCALCPVWEPCLERGLGEPVGVWGGLDAGERARLRVLRDRLASDPGDPQNAVDVRRLVRAGLSLERVSVASDMALDAVVVAVEHCQPRECQR